MGVWNESDGNFFLTSKKCDLILPSIYGLIAYLIRTHFRKYLSFLDIFWCMMYSVVTAKIRLLLIEAPFPDTVIVMKRLTVYGVALDFPSPRNFG